MKLGFFTLGCKVNQYETQAIEQFFREKGAEIGDFNGDCDGYIINTCSVTAIADKKSRGIIRRCRREHPDSVIGVCGCYSQHAADIVKEIGADVVSGSGGRVEFSEMMLSALSDKGYYEKVDNALRRRKFEVLPAGGLEERTRAMLKVQDGCVNFCTYCIIPYTRGPVRSAPLEIAIEQAKELEQKGYREIVITGIEIASWGVDLPGKPAMTELISAICEAVPSLRIRLGSLEPRVVTEALCQRLSQYKNLCNQFHLSLQSGSDTVLERMHRKYNTDRFYESVVLLRKYFPDCAITTDLIVAFPGETEEEFNDTIRFIKKCEFADMHVFPYSRRPGTPADKMPNQHNNETKESRSRKAIEVAKQMSDSYHERQLGKIMEVLFEEQEGNWFVGHTENYIKIYVDARNLHNEIRLVKMNHIYQDGIQGVLYEMQD